MTVDTPSGADFKPYLVRMPHPADGVGCALRKANAVPGALPEPMVGLMAKLNAIPGLR